MKNILFICTGNTCRSPLAERLFEHKKSNNTVTAKSAGIYATNGAQMSGGSRIALEKRGVKENHTSQPVDEELLQWADIILAMTESHKSAVIQQYPEKADHTFTLKEFVYEDKETKEKLERFKKRVAQFELKRASLHGNEQNTEEQREQLIRELENEQEAIYQLASELPGFDISDPYGGTEEMYENTAKEIEQAINKLIEKLEKEN
ncbi:low molecular weight protein arginine phosphatase [Evansella cellulosilytica]|uniref:Protein tyrosine phosphatase n=1 Tax=Evansella cellulosilytica (strain ATCC 21833 / DSM 2522 / FERM P-1141 / JCM 9156 / N-4) TaxID=649639 RepID=E6TXC1_EVAC2|nr:low molecular weight protein arginine phosphatase [Evansella cellulosilytica]ADU32316.1 protein tyrosine phosphatase [Evansella cellulosilytica DSM 2522]